MCFTDPKVTTQLDQDFIFELIQALSSKKCANSIEERSISSSKFVIIVENLLLKKASLPLTGLMMLIVLFCFRFKTWILHRHDFYFQLLLCLPTKMFKYLNWA